MNTFFQRLQSEISTLGSSTSDRFAAMLPEVLFAIIIIFVGWVAAVLLHFITIRILQFFAVDKLAAKTPLERMLKGVGIHKSVSDMLGFLVFWLAILMALVVAADALELEQVSLGLSMITGYIPQIIAALLVIVIGMLLAKFLQMLSMQALGMVGESYRRSIGKAVQGVTVFIVVIAAADVLGFDLDYILNAAVTILAVFLLLLGLSAAIGARTLLDNAVACWQLKKQISVGDAIEIDSIRGTVKVFTLTSVVLESDGDDTVFPATHFYTHLYKIS